MKKLIAVLALSALAACGSDDPGSTQNSVTPEDNAAEATTPAPAAPTIDPATPTPAPADSAAH
jgi:predicted small lipoprotein YifL